MNTDFISLSSAVFHPLNSIRRNGALKSGWLTTGQKVKAFEEDFARYVGSKYAVAVNSGTAALHLALDESQNATRSLCR